MSVSVRGLHSAAPGSLFRSADSVARQPRLTCLRFRLISGLERTRSAPGRRSRATTGWGSGRRSAPEPPCTRRRQSKTIGGCRPGNACLRQPSDARPRVADSLLTPGGPRRNPDGRGEIDAHDLTAATTRTGIPQAGEGPADAGAPSRNGHEQDRAAAPLRGSDGRTGKERGSAGARPARGGGRTRHDQPAAGRAKLRPQGEPWTWVFSDPHFEHEASVAIFGRPFRSSHHGDAYLLEEWTHELRDTTR